MKYNENNKPLVCMQTQSTCYKGTKKMPVKGVLWHSTGANNPWIKRYVQPSDNDPNRAELLALIGVNGNRNDWNHIEYEAGLNCWVGKLADGTVSTVQTMPWDYKPWGCGGGCNNGWIQFEICEDSLTDANYFNAVYREACEITAYLCKMYNLNPKGTVTVNGKKIPVILDHVTSYELGMGSGHGDVRHWFSKYGKTLDDVRNDVAALMASQTHTNKETEDDDMDVNRFKELYAEMRSELQDNDAGAWSAEARNWVTSVGIISGGGKLPDGTPNYMWADVLTREQMAAVLYRFAQLMGKA